MRNPLKKRDLKMKFALMSYNYTTNLGNEVQSIAARRFLPKIDYYIDHEKINLFNDERNVKMIMNGWYLDCAKAWPPSEFIDPLLISMHFSTSTSIKERVEALLSDESLDYFRSHGPIGCRDQHTVNFLKENEVDAYFTGCLTLTLDNNRKNMMNDSLNEEHGFANEKNNESPFNDYIIINHDNGDEIISFLKDKTDKEIFTVQQDMIPSFDKAFPETMPLWLYNLSSFYNDQEKFFMAENLLKLYEEASCVITDRLHCALPCLALKTPVLLLKDRGMKERFDGLSELVLESDLESFKKNINIFDVDNPPENPKDYLRIRKNLIEKCKDFTGHINPTYYSNLSEREIFYRNNLLLYKNAIGTRKYMVAVLKMARDYEKKLSNLENEKNRNLKEKDELIQKQQRIINEMKDSNFSKIMAPIRRIKRK